jgi:nitroreductase
MSVLDQIHSHRSIRKYQPDPVPDDVLNRILNAGLRSSSSGNMQSYSIIVTRDQKLKEKLLIPHLQQSMVVEAPVLITFCADFHRIRRWIALSKAPDSFDNFFSFLVGLIDAALVSQNVALAAEAEGLGICYLGSTLANGDQIGEILNLPPNVVPAVGFTLGYPAENPELRYRLPLDGIVHHETYQEPADEDIISLYQEKETRGWERYMKSSRLRKLVQKHAVTNLAELYTAIKYTRLNHQKLSRSLLSYLDKQQFMNNQNPE